MTRLRPKKPSGFQTQELVTPVDWSLSLKSIANPQVRGFLFSDAKPTGVIIIRPSQLGGQSVYYIPRPASLRKVMLDDKTLQTLRAQEFKRIAGLDWVYGVECAKIYR